MKSALSLVLVASLATSTVPVAAQEKTESTSGPLARSRTREVARLAAEPTSSAVDRAAQPGTPANGSSGGRVSRLSPATAIVVTAADFQPGRRIMVAADYSDLTVLNLAGVALTPAAIARLRTLAARHLDHEQRRMRSKCGAALSCFACGERPHALWRVR